MSGIAGIVDFSGKEINPKIVGTMCTNMSQRGTDYELIKEYDNAVLGFRSLNTSDSSNEYKQPFSVGNLSIILDGKIYNNQYLIKERSAKGYSTITGLDYETVLNSIDQLGPLAVNKFRGAWALAVFDQSTNKLLLSRDRFGERPLYYFRSGSRLAFASTLAGIRPAISNEKISFDCISSFLSYAHIPTRECIYEGVKKIPPGHNILFDKDGISELCYWKLDYSQPKINITFAEALEETKTLIDSSIREQILSDVPVGTQMSGGVDSGYIAAIVSKHKPEITAFTMTNPGFPEKDESNNARKIASRHNINHVEIPMDINCIAELPNILSKIEPSGDSSIIPSSFVAKEASKYVKVLLFGEGADTVFGERTLYDLHSCEGKYINKLTLNKIMLPALKFISRQRLTPFLRLFRMHCSGNRLASGGGLVPYLQSKDAIPRQVKKLIFGPTMNHLIDRPLASHLIKSVESGTYNNWWEAMLIGTVDGYFANDILHKVDSAAMHNSIEPRGIFLDHRLLEFATRVPIDILMEKGNYKRLIKSAAEEVNPFETIHAPKKGFAIPVNKYFLSGWDVILKDLLLNGVAEGLGILSYAGVVKYISKHGLRENYRLDQQLYSILVLEIWLRVFHEKTDDPFELGEKLVKSIRSN